MEVVVTIEEDGLILYICSHYKKRKDKNQQVTQTSLISKPVVSGENENRVVSDDEKSDQGAPTRFRKPPLPVQPMQRRLGHDAYNLPSPDSVASDTSIASTNSLSRKYEYLSQAATRETTRPSAASPNSIVSDTNSQIQMQQVPDQSLYAASAATTFFSSGHTLCPAHHIKSSTSPVILPCL